MPVIQIRDIDVNFPFEPYKCQIDFMNAVINCLINKKNGILESPTGTGKTLCLLCSSIAWLIRAKADLQFSAFKNDVDDGNANLTNLYKAGVTTAEPVNSDHGVYPKIIYASRTHSQLTQVVKELKMSSYNEIKTCVIGSRDQLCINPQVNSQKNYTVKMNMCKAKVTAKTCYFHNNMEANAQDLKTLNTVDIEDLVKLGAKLKICPYYSVRQLKDTADILFMPYNYLLDKKLRKSNQIELKNTVVIFDEAHNVERICEDSASTEITSTDLASAMDEIGFILDDIKYSLENDVQLSFGKDNNHDGHRGADNNDNQDPMNAKNIPATLEELGQIKMLLKELETRLDQIHIDEKLGGCTKPAVFIYELLADCGVHLNNKDIVFEILQRLLQYFGAQTTNSRHNNGASLGKFYDFVQIVFSDKSVSSANVEMDNPNSRKPSTPNVYKVHIKYDTTKARVLCYWCFSASQVMKELLDEGVRSIILTSGTLSPIGSLKTELRVPFDIVLENPHIIKGEQIKVLAINRGPKNVVLRSNYDNRLNDAYIDGLGNLIISLIRIIPSGVLVFFPSYYVLEQTLDIWKKRNLWEKIGEIKTIFVESKNTKECNETIIKYYERIRDPVYRNGSILFAVCRGKMSEGIDFSNDNGRAVILTGLPYPPFKDPRVVLKRQYLDEIKMNMLSGSEWYSQQAFRAVNQAVGRVIRHKDDYGSIILCDERFSYETSIKQMPAWIKPHLIKVNDCQMAIDQLKSFFNVVTDFVPRPAIAQVSSSATNKNNGNIKKNFSGNNYCQMVVDDYKNPDTYSLTSSTVPIIQSSNFDLIDRLDSLSDGTTTPLTASGTSMSSKENNANMFNDIVQKRKIEEAKLNMKTKTKIVIKDTCVVNSVKNPVGLANSKNLLIKVNEALKEDENREFKLALHNFHYSKKTNDADAMLKYYLVLKSIFKANQQLFSEIETFIRYKPPTASKVDDVKFTLKRKFTNDDN